MQWTSKRYSKECDVRVRLFFGSFLPQSTWLLEFDFIEANRLITDQHVKDSNNETILVLRILVAITLAKLGFNNLVTSFFGKRGENSARKEERSFAFITRSYSTIMYIT